MRKRKNDNEYQLISQNQFHIAEAYKSLRTNLEYSFFENKNKVILITSSVPKEGKSSITANLGVYLTYIGYKVLLIDCDFRKPKLNRFFNLPNQTGIINAIIKKTALHDVLNHVSPKLDVIPNGAIPPNPVELLNSKELEDLIQELTDQYNYVLIDSPPAATLTDAVVLAPYADGVILVVKHAATPVEIIKQTIDNLNNANANMLGVVISQVNTKADSYYRYRYYDYYNDKSKAAKPNKDRFQSVRKFFLALTRCVKNFCRIIRKLFYALIQCVLGLISSVKILLKKRKESRFKETPHG